MRRSLLVVVLAVLMVVAMSAGAFAGEITGNGKPLWIGEGADDPAAHHTLHGKSHCAFSGQEDGQFFTEPGGEPVDPVVKGEPAHAQSWGQIPKAFRDAPGGLFHPGNSCNPNGDPLPPPPA
jgi:hypothetical protein